MTSAMRARIVSALLGGLLCGQSYVPGYWGLMMWVGFVPFLISIERVDLRRSFLLGWLFGTVAWMVGFRFLHESIQLFFSVNPIVAGLLFFTLCAYLGLMWALIAAAVAAFAEDVRDILGCSLRTAGACVFVPAAVFAEWVFPLFNPMPAAHTQLFHLPLVQSLDIVGTAGVGWLLFGFNAAVFLALRSHETPARRWTPLKVCVGLLMLVEIFGWVRMGQVDAEVAVRAAKGISIRAAVLQGSIPREHAESPERFQENLDIYNQLTKEALDRGPHDLIVWPHNAYERKLVFDADDAGRKKPRVDRKDLDGLLASDLQFPVPAVLSSPGEVKASKDGRRARRTYKTAFLTGSEKQYRGSVGKFYLTPFDDFIPLGRYFPGLYLLAPKGVDRLSRGPRRLLFLEDGTRLGILVCYEEFVSKSAAWYARSGAQLLVGVSNDIDLGSLGQAQRLSGAVLRAIENRKFVLRSVATGISAVIDPVGRVLQRLESGRRGSISARVVLMDDPAPQLRFGRLLYQAAGLLMLLLLALRTSIFFGP